MLATSLSPIVSESARILILGTMPGRDSLARQQYYAHPGNAFWFIMKHVCGAGVELSYEERVRRLQDVGFALWDVLKHCEREGSLDSKIVKASEAPNDIETLLNTYPNIHLIVFNGGKAAESFRRRVWLTLSAKLRGRI